MTAWFARQPLTRRLTLAFIAAMSVLLLCTSAFIYERMQFALDRSIRDVPASNHREIDARRRHRNEALDELLVQLAIAFGLTLGVSALAGYRTARGALDPVERIRRRAESIEPGDDGRLPVPDTGDEIARLAVTLNNMLARLQEAVTHERQFVSDASHELRTPLSLLKMQVDVALSRERSTADLQNALRHISTETDRLISLANDLLVAARADAGALVAQPVALQLDELVNSVAARFSLRAATGSRPLVVGVDPIVVHGDPTRLDQAITNLIENALRHGCGDVTIRCALAPSGDEAEVHVIDDGPGLPAHFAGKAFDRFTTADASRTGAGSGLGLWIVRAIARAHGGEAGIGNRAAGRGCDAWIRIPRHAAATDRQAVGFTAS